MASYLPRSPPGLSSARESQAVFNAVPYSLPLTPSPLRHSETYSIPSTSQNRYESSQHRDDSAAQEVPLLPPLPTFTPLFPLSQYDEDDRQLESHQAPPVYVDPFTRPGGYRWKLSQHRPPYMSLSEAVYDESAPEFSPNDLTTTPTRYLNEKDFVIDSPTAYQQRSYDRYRHSDTKSTRCNPRVLYPHGLPSNGSRRKHPFAKGFEPLRYRSLALHFVLCAVAYPILRIAVILAKGKSLFWTRALVGIGAGVVGCALGVSLMRMGKRILEAATWATIIHQSRIVDGPGVRLRDLQKHSGDPTSAWPALRLLWDRHAYPGAARATRKNYDSRPWTIYILFFLFIVIFSVVLPFVFGRVVIIETHIMHQHEKYVEVPVYGDLSAADIKQADYLQSVFEDPALMTWTLSPFSIRDSLPSAVTLSWGSNSVYFSEIGPSQLLVPGGHGFGTFQNETPASSTSPGDSELRLAEQSDVPMSSTVDPGSILRFPRWGIRIRCVNIPNGQVNIVPFSESNLTYLFTPRETLRSLFTEFNLTLPDVFEQPMNLTSVVNINDTLPGELNVPETALGTRFLDNGIAYSLASTPVNMGEGGSGFVTIESVLIRLNTSFAPLATFSQLSDTSTPDTNGNSTSIGYDAAVCLELYEPWVLEIYNSTTGLPISMKISTKGGEIEDTNTTSLLEKNTGPRVNDPSVKRRLESTGSRSAYIAAHQSSVNQMLKDNGGDVPYVPSPTLVSFTDGQGPFGYTSLSSALYAESRAIADANNALPYLTGSGLTVARRYPDLMVTTAFIHTLGVIVVLVSVFIVGVVTAMFVPSLPMSVPRRGFDVYSWLAAFHGGELVAVRTSGLGKNMELEEIEKRVGELRFRYVD